MDGNAVRACFDYGGREFVGVRMLCLARISDQGNLIQVNAQLRHGDSRLTDRITTGVTGTS